MDPKLELGRLAQGAAGRIRQRRLRAGRAHALREALPLLLVFPAGYALFEAVRLAVGAPARPLSPWVLALGSCALPLLWWAARLGREAVRGIDRREALATVDRALDLRDRLQSADEFLGASEPTPFMRAAIEDAVARLEAARRAEWSLTPPVVRGPGLRLVCIAAAIGLGALAFWLGQREGLDAATSGEPAREPRREALAALEEKEDPGPAEPVSPEAPEARREASPRGDKAPETPGNASEMASDEVKESKGTAGVGRSAQASSAQGASRSQATPSNQAQSSQSEPENAKAQPKKKEEPPTPPREQPERKPGEEAGATSARGSAKGSNRNPSSSDWSSRDQSPADEEKLLDNDEEIEDDDESQESRGGVQPNLRDRKPPVNRDLRIGFGNRKNPDANGRGGPSEAKKSRGVASLVLGVPIPDRVKGQPNPGRTKITQERIEPQAEPAERLEAGARAPRADAFGHHAPRPLPPWMRSFVRDYFLFRRTDSETP